MESFFYSILGSIIGSTVAFYIAKRQYLFESLHTKRFGVLEEIYLQLVTTHSKAKKLFLTELNNNPDKTLSDLDDFNNSLFSLYEYAKQKAVFLSESELTLMKRFFTEVEKFQNNLGYKGFMKIMPSDDYNAGETFKEIRLGVYDSIPKIITEIERDFKKSLGL